MGDKWSYEGIKKPKAILISESIKFEALKMKIVEKVKFDHERYDLQLKYVSPTSGMLPPFDVSDNDDLESFKILNTKASKEGV